MTMDTILLTGKTGFFSKEALQYIGETAQVFVTGSRPGTETKGLPESVRLLPAAPSDDDFRTLFELGEIRAVWHVAGYADSGRAAADENGTDRIAQLCSHYGVPRMIILTESTDPVDYRKMISKWEKPGTGVSPVEIAVVRLPFVIGSGTEGGRLDRIFSAMRRDDTVRFEGGEETNISILPMPELISLLLRMTMETWFRTGIFAADGSDGSLKELRAVLLSIRPGARIEYSGNAGRADSRTLRVRFPMTGAEDCDGQLKEMYRLPVTADWGALITDQYSELVKETGESTPLKERIRSYMKTSGKLVTTVIDLAIMFILSEYLAKFTSSSVYFKIVDVRLIYVILMGMMHGIGAGFAAAILECIMLVIRYNEIGISGLLLFYNVENWIPFVYYLTGGIISGYTHQKREQEMRSVMKENELIRNKYLFLNEAYRTSVANRKDLWAQILNEEDSYGKIYSAVRRMSQRTPEAVCVEAVDVFRRLLKNETISVYEMDPAGKKASLLSCCRNQDAPPSIDTTQCREMFRTLQNGETWKNTHFSENAPMYAAQVVYSRMFGQKTSAARNITYIVTLDHAEQDQLSLWYMNHFTILCGLFQDALESASMRERVMS